MANDGVGEGEGHEGQAHEHPEDQRLRLPDAQPVEVEKERAHDQREEGKKAGQGARHHHPQLASGGRARLAVVQDEADDGRRAINDEDGAQRPHHRTRLAAEGHGQGRIRHAQDPLDEDEGHEPGRDHVDEPGQARPAHEHARGLREDEQEMQEHRPEEDGQGLTGNEDHRHPGRRPLNRVEQLSGHAEEQEREGEQGGPEVVRPQRQQQQARDQEEHVDEEEGDHEEHARPEADGCGLEREIEQALVPADDEAVRPRGPVKGDAGVEAGSDALAVEGDHFVPAPKHAVHCSPRAHRPHADDLTAVTGDPAGRTGVPEQIQRAVRVDRGEGHEEGAHGEEEWFPGHGRYPKKAHHRTTPAAGEAYEGRRRPCRRPRSSPTSPAPRRRRSSFHTTTSSRTL